MYNILAFGYLFYILGPYQSHVSNGKKWTLQYSQT